MTGADNDCSLGGAFEHHFGPRGREFERSYFQKFKCPGFARGGWGMLKFRVDRRISSQVLRPDSDVVSCMCHT